MNASLPLPPAFCVSLLLTFGHFLWQGAVVFVFASAVLVLLRRASAHARYAVSLTALLLMAACPPVTFLLTSQAGPHTAAIPLTPQASATSMDHVAEAPSAKMRNDRQEHAGPAHKTATRRFVGPAWRVPGWEGYASYIVLAYLVGTGVMLARVVLGVNGGRRLRKRSQPVDDAAILATLVRQARSLGLRLTPAIAYCREIAVPTVVGVLRPLILIPLSAASGLSADQLDMLLAHELAHIRRYDHVVNLLQRLIEAILFFHPAVWLVSRRIRTEREHCCDDIVVALGGQRLPYADSLVRMAELSLHRPQAVAVPYAVTLGAQGQPSRLRQRILRLIAPSQVEPLCLAFSWRRVIVVLTLLVVGIVLLWSQLLRPRPEHDLNLRQKSVSNLKAIRDALFLVPRGGRDRLPSDLQALVEEGTLRPEQLISPVAPTSTQPAYRYIPPTSPDGRNIIIYENPAHYGNEGTLIVWADGHIDWSAMQGFEEALRATRLRHQPAARAGESRTGHRGDRIERTMPANPSSRPAPAGGVGGPSGTLLGVDGKPLARATVILVRPALQGRAYAAHFLNGGIHDARNCLSYETKPDGRFEFPPQDQTTRIVALHEQGCAEALSEELARPAELRLQPWGHVEGDLRITGQPRVKQKVVCQLVAEDIAAPRMTVLWQSKAETDEQGGFTFERVLPRRMFVGREIHFSRDRSMVSFDNDHAVAVDVQPGETSHVVIGGTGQAVIGRVTLPARAGVELADLFVYVWLRPGQLKPALPRDVRTMSPADRLAWYATWLKSEQGQAYVQARHTSYAIAICPDGGFRIADVPAGTYQLHLWAYKRHLKGGWGLGEEIGSVLREVMIASGPDEQPDAELDLGTLQLQPAPGQKQNRPARPPSSAPAAKPDSFGPVIERVINDDGARGDFLINLDTGELFTPPPKESFPEPQQLLDWVKHHGIDAMGETKVSVRGLMGFEMVAIPITNEQWDPDPSFLLGELAMGQPGTPAVMSGKGGLPVTFFIRTREGGRGVLQLVGFTPHGVRVRYRMLRTAAVNDASPDSQPALGIAPSPTQGPAGMVGTWFFDNPMGDEEQMAIFADGRVVVLYSNGHKDDTRLVADMITLAEYGNLRAKLTLLPSGLLLQTSDEGKGLGKLWERIDPVPQVKLLRPLSGTPNEASRVRP